MAVNTIVKLQFLSFIGIRVLLLYGSKSPFLTDKPSCHEHIADATVQHVIIDFSDAICFFAWQRRKTS